MMLNKKEPYQQVIGGRYPYQFIQNGKFFTGQGVEVTENGKIVTDADEVKDEPATEEPNAYLDKPEIMQALDRLEVEYDARWSRDRLHKLLEESVK